MIKRDDETKVYDSCFLNNQRKCVTHFSKLIVFYQINLNWIHVSAI